MLITKSTLTERIKEDWGDGENRIDELCLELMDYLINLPEVVELMPFGFLHIATKRKYNIDELFLVVQYLCGDRMNLLSLSLNEECGKDIPKEKLNEYAEKDVFIYFLPSETCKVIKKIPTFTSFSMRNGDYEYWQTGVEPLAWGIDRDSLLGENLGLAMSCCRDDSVIYTLNKVN